MFFTSLIDLFLRPPDRDSKKDVNSIGTAIVYITYFTIMLFLALSVI
jgi:hypothetical protein